MHAGHPTTLQPTCTYPEILDQCMQMSDEGCRRILCSGWPRIRCKIICLQNPRIHKCPCSISLIFSLSPSRFGPLTRRGFLGLEALLRLRRPVSLRVVPSSSTAKLVSHKWDGWNVRFPSPQFATLERKMRNCTEEMMVGCGACFACKYLPWVVSVSSGGVLDGSFFAEFLQKPFLASPHLLHPVSICLRGRSCGRANTAACNIVPGVRMHTSVFSGSTLMLLTGFNHVR